MTLFISMILIGMTGNLKAQEEAISNRHIIKVKPLSFEFAYEQMVNDFLGIQTNIRIFPVSIGTDEDRVSFANYRIMPEARFYVASRKGAPQGFFVAPFVKAGLSVVSAKTTSDSDLTEKAKFKGTSLGGGLTLGWQWVKKSGFSIDTQFGWGYTSTRFRDLEVQYSDGTVEVETPDIDNLSIMLPRICFSIGYAF